MANKLYGVFEICWPSCQNRETKLTQKKTKQAPDFGTRRAYCKLSEQELEQARNSEMYKEFKNA